MQSVFQEVLSLCNLFLNRRFSELSSQRYSQLSMEEKRKFLNNFVFTNCMQYLEVTLSANSLKPTRIKRICMEMNC